MTEIETKLVSLLTAQNEQIKGLLDSNEKLTTSYLEELEACQNELSKHKKWILELNEQLAQMNSA